MTSSQTRTGLRRIGEYLPCSQADIEWALGVQQMESASGNIRHLGEILVARERLTQEILAEGLQWQRADRLRFCSLLAGTSDEDLARISESTPEVVLEPGEVLFHSGQRGDGAYVVLKGRVLLSCSEHEFEHPAGVALPGDVLGDSEFLTGGTHRCSAYATERSVVLKILYELLPRRMICCEESISLDLAVDGGPDAVITIERRACEVLRADRARVFVRDPDTGELTAHEGKEEIRVPAGTNIVGWVAQTQEIVNLPEAQLDPRFDAERDARTGYGTRTLLAAPVLDADARVVAVIEVLNKRTGRFTPDDEALLHALTHECAPALQSLCP